MSSRLSVLFGRRQFSAKFSLEGIRSLCQALGNPEKNLNFLHIAGTNGKGSVAAMSAAILQQAGFKTGLYTSPHLIRYHERFRINGEQISDAHLERTLERVMKVVSESHTFFEISTAIALCWFQEQGVEWAVWETGLGGRLDATNIVSSKVSVITRIGLDHTQYLGETLSKIAEEKAGIIKTGIPVITQVQEPEVLEVISKRAESTGSEFILIQEKDLGEFQSPLVGEYQRWNTALAVAAIKKIHPEIKSHEIAKGLKATYWPGRCMLIQRGGGLPDILIDGAHNELGATALAHEIEHRWGKGKAILIFGALKDKNIHGMVQILTASISEFYLTPVASDRSASLADLAQCVPHGRAFANLNEALSTADRQARPIVIAGSLFLAGEALLRLSNALGELHPNENLLTPIAG
jgi:dihydrofolate synthase / folylpolyglutamate synthase